jgi:hypothetical protein
MRTERANSTMPVLLGMALSLLVMLLVVGCAAAANDCDLCLRNANNNAKTACAGDPDPYCVMKKYKVNEQKDCINTQRCPGSGSFTGQKDCGSSGCRAAGSIDPNVLGNACGDGVDPNAGAICDNDCWGRPCTGGTGTCADLAAPGAKPGKASLCYTKCGCSD